MSEMVFLQCSLIAANRFYGPTFKDFCFSVGGHQTDQLAEATKERANYQRDPGHEGDEESQHCQLCR